MAKPVMRFKVNQQSAAVGGKYYGIIEDTPVTPANSILQICEFKKITAFAPEQVLRLVEDVCDGAAQLVARDGQSRQISSLLKFSPRVRGTFAATDSRWSDQKLIVGARLLKDIKLDIDPSKFTMSNVADVGTLQSVAVVSGTPYDINATMFTARINGAKLGSWSTDNTFVTLEFDCLINGQAQTVRIGDTPDSEISDIAANGFTYDWVGGENTIGDLIAAAAGGGASVDSIESVRFVVFHPDKDTEFGSLTLAKPDTP